MALNCLRGCITGYTEGGPGVEKLIDHALMAPFVEVWLGDPADKQKSLISIGNFSSKNKKAVVNSMKLGGSNGFGCTIEIIDESGGNFYNYFFNLTRGNLDGQEKTSNLYFRFGWVWRDCNGKSSYPPERGSGVPIRDPERKILSSRTHVMKITSISCDNSQDGAFKFTITGTDTFSDTMTTIVSNVFGTSDKKLHLTSAIKFMMADLGIEVDFLNETNGPLLWTTKTGSNLERRWGPLGVWRGNGMPAILAAKSWLNDHLSLNGKGITEFFESTVSEERTRLFGDKPLLIFKESPRITCVSQIKYIQRLLGTYIVNGGACSPVISFKPSFTYQPQMTLKGSVGGMAGGGPMTSKDVTPNVKGPISCISDTITNAKNQGMQVIKTTDDNAVEKFGFDGGIEVITANLTNEHVNKLGVRANPISAELKIQGDPTLDSQRHIISHFVSIVYLNPFNIAEKPFPTLREFEASNPFCNNVLSNRYWFIKGFQHEISEGGYTTTLDLNLAFPGVDLPEKSQIGADPRSVKMRN